MGRGIAKKKPQKSKKPHTQKQIFPGASFGSRLNLIEKSNQFNRLSLEALTTDLSRKTCNIPHALKFQPTLLENAAANQANHKAAFRQMQTLATCCKSRGDVF